VRTGTDERNLGAVNLDGQASLDTGAELPDEGKPAASQRSTCGFQGYGKLTVNFPKYYGISGVIKPDSILKKRDAVLFVVACFKPDITNYAVIHVRRIVENADVGKLGYGKLSKRDGRLSSRNNDNVVPIGRIEGKGCPIVAP
jgi:hypothetical protein